MALEFVKPAKALEGDILAFRQAFLAAGETVINGSAGLDFYPTFAEWLAYIQAVEAGEEEGFVPSEVWLARRPGERRILGILDIRPHLPKEKEKFGHIGYAVAPAARGQGIATVMVAWGVEKLRQSGLAEALACCYDSNTPSYKTLEKNGFYRTGSYNETDTGYGCHLQKGFTGIGQGLYYSKIIAYYNKVA